MEQSGLCGSCGDRLTDGRCKSCARRIESRFIHREILALVVLFAVVAVGFVLTKAAADANRALRLRDAAAWYGVGERALSAGHADDAVVALRRATGIDRNHRGYRFALATALTADKRDDTAREILLGIREDSPEDAEINLRLARLAARSDDLSGAVRYYQNALYGVWGGDQTAPRRQVRVELIQYLLEHNERARALAELLVFSANLPDDAALQAEAGRLYLRAGEPRRSLEHFTRALRRVPTSEAATAGAAEAAFQAGDYAAAQRYLRAAPASDRVTELREVVEYVLARDPLRPGLPFVERQARLAFALGQATSRLDACLTLPNDLARNRKVLESLGTEARAFASALSSKTVPRSQDAIENGVNLVYRIEQQTATGCPPASALDRALLRIGERYEAGRQ
jgi:tetratricopeptide (TPR) repeat protein